MQEVAAGVEIAASVAAMIAQGESTRMKIEEGIADYEEEVKRLEETKLARETQMMGKEQRAKQIGIAGLTEQAAAGKYETETAMMKAEMTSSSAQARIGASGVKATGSALMGAQQATDIAYAAADRTAEAAAAGIRIGGLELGNQLQTATGERSLLTMEYRQTIEEQRRKKTELETNKNAMVAWAYLGGLAGVSSSFYNAAANTNLFGNNS
jgi:hypothetical protein